MAPQGVAIRFYGVRGSLTVPGADTVRVGGNTSCVLYSVGDEMIVLDSGSGIRVLGNELMRQKKSIRANVLLSHYHWDHLLGLPFFAPIYSPTTELAFHGEHKFDSGVKEEIQKQFMGPNFPVERKDLSSKLSFHDIKPGDRLAFGEAQVTVFRLNHPNLCLGFCIEARGTKLVYATDHEQGTAADADLVSIARDADCLIYDAMYTQEEYSSRATGWGHSTWNEGVRIAGAARVKQLFLFHHDPDRDDDEVDAIEAAAKRAHPHSAAAREGVEHVF
ncbi:MAG: MBL fold metallo-hydrolase [Deltaproteobacteria bacterium]|nr:MBL fold metallo-hydrolase [Deltaproteobacteria bacterium]